MAKRFRLSLVLYLVEFVPTGQTISKRTIGGGGDPLVRLTTSHQRIARALKNIPKVVTPTCRQLLLQNFDTKTVGSI